MAQFIQALCTKRSLNSNSQKRLSMKYIVLLFALVSMPSLAEINDYLRDKYPDNVKELAYLVQNHDISMSSSESYWKSKGGFPKEIEKLEHLGFIYVVKYKFGDDGLGFKIYPTQKAIELFEKTELNGKYRIEDIKTNLQSFTNNDRYFYITGYKT